MKAHQMLDDKWTVQKQRKIAESNKKQKEQKSKKDDKMQWTQYNT